MRSVRGQTVMEMSIRHRWMQLYGVGDERQLDFGSVKYRMKNDVRKS